jgi:hypothetical protein
VEIGYLAVAYILGIITALVARMVLDIRDEMREEKERANKNTHPMTPDETNYHE